MIAYKHEIAALGADDARIGQPNTVQPRVESPRLVENVRLRARQLGESLIAIDEAHMNYGHITAKWEYAAVAHSIAAQWETNPAKRIALAQETVRDGRYADQLIDWVQERAATGDRYYVELLRDLHEQDERSRVSYVVALGLAILAAEHDESATSNDVTNELSHISSEFTSAYPLAWNPWFAPYLKGRQ